MNMRSPVFTMLWAMLWENWRLTRVEVAWRLALGIVGGTAVLAVLSSQREAIKDFSAAIALSLIVLPHFSSTPVRFGHRYSSPSRWRTSPRCRRRYTSCRRFS